MYLIHKCALVIVKDNRLLVVRKKGSRDFLMPGGKPKGRESAVMTVRREIMEELGCDTETGSLVFVGAFEDYTSDKKARVEIKLYTGNIIGTPKPCSEIDELAWISPKEANSPKITPIIKNEIMPFLVESGIISDDANV